MSKRLIFFGGIMGIAVLLLGVVAILFARGPNYVQYSSVPFTGEERYFSDKFDPAFSFETVGEGWTLDGPEAPYVLALQGRGLSIDFQNLKDLMFFDPRGADTILAPEDMVGWYQQHPYLDTEESEPMSIGGVKGVYFDAIMTSLPEGHPLACEEPGSEGVSLTLISAPDGFVLCITPEDKVRIILLEDVNGEPVSIMVWSNAVDFEENLPRAQKLLKSVEWEGA